MSVFYACSDQSGFALRVMIVSQDANANLLARFDKFSNQFFDSLRLEMTIDKINIAEDLMFKPISKRHSKVDRFRIKRDKVFVGRKLQP